MHKKMFLRFLVVALFLMFIVGVSNSQAALLGIKDYLKYPDITFDVAGVLDYSISPGGPSPQGTLTISGYDYKITMTKNGPVFFLTDTNANPPFSTGFYLQITVDTSGKLISGSMMEKVLEGTVEIMNKGYQAGTILLKGDVYAFGYEPAGAGGNQNQFDFLIKNLSGALVTDNLWPKNVPTGIYAHAEGQWDGKFDKNFTLYTVTGDKAPVPLPATLLLFGSGLSAFGLIRIKRKRG